MLELPGTQGFCEADFVKPRFEDGCRRLRPCPDARASLACHPPWITGLLAEACWLCCGHSLAWKSKEMLAVARGRRVRAEGVMESAGADRRLGASHGELL